MIYPLVLVLVEGMGSVLIWFASETDLQRQIHVLVVYSEREENSGRRVGK